MYKTILVHVDGTARSALRIDIAAQLAIRHNAHLIGTAVTGLGAFMFPVAMLDPSAPAIAFPVAELRADADLALDQFDNRARQAGVPSFERRRVDDEAGMGLCMQARYADLVVLGQAEPADFPPHLPSDFPEFVLLNCARPVLVVPAAGIRNNVGRRVTVAWNGSVDAVRAITSAIALLQRSEQVHLVVFNADAERGLHGDSPGADIALFLARHGIKVDVTAADSAENVGQSLLSFAIDHGSDLIVMGAYGHSRLRETLLGGVTRTALSSSALPLWMAH
jgi:nucleotide-binding universal stress UspA family protein